MAVVEHSLDRFVDSAEEVLSRPGAAPDRLAALVELTAEHYGNDELLHSSLFGETDLVEGAVAQMAAEHQRKQIRGLLERVLTTGQAEGTVRPDLDATSVAAVLLNSAGRSFALVSKAKTQRCSKTGSTSSTTSLALASLNGQLAPADSLCLWDLMSYDNTRASWLNELYSGSKHHNDNGRWLTTSESRSRAP